MIPRPGAPRRAPARPALRALLVLVLAAGALSACGRARPRGDVASLRTGFLRAGVVDVHVEPGDLEDACRRAASRRSRARDGYALAVRHRAQGEDGNPRLFVGTPADPYVRSLALRAGCTAQGKRRFEVEGRVFDAPGDLFIACFEDPERPGLPIGVWMGNDARALAAQLDALGASWLPHARVLRGGEALLELDLEPSGRPRAPARRGAGALRAAALSRSQPYEAFAEEGIHLRVAGAVAPPRLRRYGEDCVLARERVLRWATLEEPVPAVTVALWSVAQDLVDLPGRGALSSVPSALGRAGHALLAPALADDGGAVAAQASALAALGPCLVPWLPEAAGCEAADRWWGRGLESWVAWLAAAECLPSPAELLDPRAAELRTPHAVGPARALLVRHLLEERGAAFVRELWLGLRPLPSAAELEARWTSRLRALVARHAEGHEGWRDARRAERGALGRAGAWNGFALEPSLVEGATPLGSARAAATIDALAGPGVRALGLTSFLVAGRPPLGRTGPDLTPQYGSLEGDAALAGGLAGARRAGLATLLVPEVLAGPGGVRAGELLRGLEEHWDAFFDEQGRALEHYALVCELVRADALALGAGIGPAVDFGRSSRRADPREAQWKRAGWTRLLARLRGAFSGGLTYVATWPGEPLQVALWPELDLIALELFPLGPASLHAADAPGLVAERVGQALEAAQSLAAALEKPLVIARFALPGGERGPGEGELQREGLALLEQALGARPPLGGVLLGRVGLDPAEAPLGPSDVLLRASAIEEARALLARLGGER